VVRAGPGASGGRGAGRARRRAQGSRVGQALAPAADRLFTLVTLLGAAWRDVVPVWLVVVIVARDVLLAGLMPLLAHHGYGPLPVSFAGKAGTFALLYAFPLLLLAEMPGWVGDVAAVTAWAFTWWGVGLYWLAGAQYVLQTRALVISDRAASRRGEDPGPAT